MTGRDDRSSLDDVVTAAARAKRSGRDSTRNEAGRPEAIAIVGMACRFPGGANSPEDFWELLESGKDPVSEVPSDRWNIDDFYSPAPARAGKMTTRFASFLDGVDQFDSQFFGITPREAARLDPQHRLLLEVSWEALENAGFSPDRMAGSDTGVFVGLSTTDYGYLQVADIDTFNGHAGFGSAHCMAPGRISYFFDFHGPNAAIDTACSSSLVAVHMACTSLRNRECSAALAGGVNVIVSPHITVCLSEWGVLAPDGRCKTFDSSADGFGRSEGCGVVVLKRLSDAVADGDNILAVIRGTAMNQDGRGTRLSSPNGKAQVALLRNALADAGVEAGQISLVEAHGTGTPIGDPIEVQALTEVIGKMRSDDSKCALVAVKANIGHSEAAAGVAGLIKTVLCIQNNRIPGQLHLKELNPRIDLENTPFYIPTKSVEWGRDGGTRYAGVSSFGLSGTNVHLILEDPPPATTTQRGSKSQQLLTLSARKPEALQTLAEKYRDFLLSDAASDASPADICYTAALGRSHHPYRAAVVGTSKEELADRLAGLSEKDLQPRPVPGGMPERVAMIFSGQGSQWVGMGTQLLEEEPVFRDKLAECDAVIKEFTGWSLLSELKAEAGKSRLNQTDVAQPAIFSIQVALAALFESWGIRPDAVTGHSSGEIAAAYAAGVLSLEDAVRVVHHRARLMQKVAGKGRMAAVGLSYGDAQEAISSQNGRLSVAAVNGPTLTVIAGEPEAVAEVQESLRSRNVFVHDLGVNYAFHTSQMDPYLAELQSSLTALQTHPASTLFVSTVTAREMVGHEFDAGHWASNMRQPVHFAEAMNRLLDEEFSVFLEVGPHPVLAAPMAQCLEQRGIEGTVLGSLRRGQDERSSVLRTLGSLFVAGCEVDWRGLYPKGGRVTRLPNYPWQHRRHWLPDTPSFATSTTAPVESTSPTVTLDHDSQEVIASFYDRFSKTAEGDEAIVHLTFAPLLEPVEGFSWIRMFYALEEQNGLDEQAPYIEMTRRAQRQMREVLFRGIDFSSIRSVLDFGCGYGTDVISLAQKHPHLICDGYTLSAKQTELGNRRARAADLQDRVSIYQRDSAADEFPRQYDLVFGFEVASYIQDKEKLFSHIDRHLTDGGYVVLADFIANTLSEIPHHATSSFISTLDQWCDVLAQHKLRVVDCVNVNKEIANFLYDADAEKNLSFLVNQTGNEGWLREHFGSYDGLGRLLRKRLATYALMTIQKDRFLARAEVARINREKLSNPMPYADVVQRLGSNGDRAAAVTTAPLGELRDWVYEMGWKAAPPVAASTELAGPGSWLILADDKGIGDAVAELLARSGQVPITVYAGRGYEALGSGRFIIDPTCPDEFGRMVADALSAAEAPWRGVIHLWGVDARPPHRMTLHSLEEDQGRGTGSLLHLVQALSAVGWDRAPTIWIGTQGAQSPSGPISPAQGSLWGLARTIGVEQPGIWGGLVDLDSSASSKDAAEQLLQTVMAGDGEDQVAYHQGTRYVARLRPRPELTDGQPVRLRPDATYLVTGGLGGLGLEVARWMVDSGARHLALLQRSALPPRSEWETIDRSNPVWARISRVVQLEEAGAEVHVYAADASREDEVARVLTEIRRLPTLRGIVHAAGLPDYGMLPQLTLEGLQRVLAPKVSGAWNLHRLTLSEPLDFFVLYSSVSAWLGSPGLASYAAANAGLDAFAHYRRSEGLPALSINWGPWSEVGMAAGLGTRGERMAERGIGTIAPHQGVRVLERLLGQAQAQVAVLPLKLDHLRRAWPQAARMPLLAELTGEQPQGAMAALPSIAKPAAPRVSPPTSEPLTLPPVGVAVQPVPAPEPRPAMAAGRESTQKASSLRDALDAAAPSERLKIMEQYLSEQTARVLQLAVADVNPREALTRMGIDSLMAVELRNHIEADLSVSVQLVKFLEGASLADLAKDFVREYVSKPAGEGPATPDDVLQQIEQMSDEEVEALLAEKKRQLAR